MAASEMAPVLSMMALISVVTSFTLPHYCRPGFYMDSGACKECAPGQFTNVYNQFSQCSPHRICKKSEYVELAGNSTRDTVCTCKDGGRDYYAYDEKYGYDCRRCIGGYVSRPVLHARYQGDVACCPPHHQAYRNDAGDLRCSREAAPAPRPPSSDGGSDKGSLDKRPYIVGFTILGVFIVVIVVCACYVRRKRRNNNTNSARIAADAAGEINKDRKESMSTKSTKEYAQVPSQ